MDISSISDFISNTVDQYIVRPTGNLIGVDGFIFDIIDNEEVIADSEITDHYVEDNFAIADHIALKPVIFTLRGFVGEITRQNENASQINQLLNNIANISAFLPVFADQASQVYKQLTNLNNSAVNVLNLATSIYGLYSDYSTTTNKQQGAYNYFKALRDSRILCQVETPFGVFNNMAILRLQAVQKGDTKLISDFLVTFKEIRTVSSLIIANSPVSGGSAGGGSPGISPFINQVSSTVTSFAGRVDQAVQAVAVTGEGAGDLLNGISGAVYSVSDLSNFFITN
jgi:prophage DNA circulation protein